MLERKPLSLFLVIYIYIYTFHETHLRILQKIVLETADFLFFFFFLIRIKLFERKTFDGNKLLLHFEIGIHFEKRKVAAHLGIKLERGHFLK